MIRVGSLGLRLLLVGVLTALGSAVAAQGSYSEQPEVQAFMDEMVGDHGFERSELESWFSEVSRSESVIERISAPAERVLNWGEYRDIFVTDSRIEAGHRFIAQYNDDLQRAEEKTGVPLELIAAIIGVETFYGRHRGTHGVLEALSTLAFDYPPRSNFFRSELEQYLLLVREQGFDPLELKGSYAGAMGYGQFISSSYRHYAIDFDGDGVADILDNPADAIGSVANYISEHNWRTGEPVVERVQANESARERFHQDRLRPAFTVGQLREGGIELGAELSGEAPAKLITLEGRSGKEDWVGFHNFYVITRYNHSDLYAMAVYQLAQALSDQDYAAQ